MGATPSKAIKAKVDALFAAKDKAGLEALRGTLVVATETARMRFSRTRSIKDGETFRRKSAELGLVRTQMSLLRDEKLEEGPRWDAVKGAAGATTGAVGDKLKNAAGNAVQTAADRVLYHVGGSQTARGRLDAGAALTQMAKDWRRFVGQRQKAGNKNIVQQPTHRDVLMFLQYAYGIQMNDEQLMSVLNSTPGEQPNGQEAPKPKTADEWGRAAVDHLKATSPEEYAALKKKWTKKESVEYVFEDLNSPVNTKQLFPKLADFLLLQGLFKVKRGKEIVGAKGVYSDDDSQGAGTAAQAAAAPAKGAPQAPAAAQANTAPVANTAPAAATANAPAEEPKPGTPEPTQTTDTRVTADGHAIDVNKMKSSMTKDGLTAQDMMLLRKVVGQGVPSKDALQSLQGNPDAIKSMVSLVSALLRSISNKNDPNNEQAQHSISPNGTMFDINKFVKSMARANVTGDDLKNIRATLSKGGEKALMNVLADDGRQSKMIFSMATAALGALVTKKQNPDDFGPLHQEQK